jgi:dethiobiotin synthetase
MAPPIAAEVLESAPFHVAELVAEVTSDTPVGAIVLVESVGGVRSPIAIDGDTVTLVGELKPALVVLVADAELGTINLVRLSHDVLLAHRTVVYLNRYEPDDEMHVRNHEWLVTHLGLEVVTDPEALEEVVAALIR